LLGKVKWNLPLRHGADSDPDPTHGSHESELGLEDLFDRSRIAGAINILSACAIGHKGPIALSAVEDSFVIVKAR
jgi:hypothetical protein